MYAVSIQTSVSIFVIRSDLVQTKRVKYEVCLVGRFIMLHCPIPYLSIYKYVPLYT